MSEQKTHAEIIAEMRTKAECAKPYDDGIVMMLTDFADRLDTAHKRDIEDAERRGNHAATKAICETIEKVGPLYDAESVGNAVKMRESLESVKELARTIYSTSEKGSSHEDLADKIVELARAALAAPTRNCDLYADEQSAWEAFSEKRQGPDSSTEEYEQWLFEKATA